MSSLAGSLSPAPRAQARAVGLPRVSADAAVTFGVAFVLAAISVAAQGGLRLERTTWTEIGMMLAGAGLMAYTLLAYGLRSPLRGAVTMLGLIALAVYTAASITWSLSPSDSWLEANRTFAYIAVFAGSLALVRVLPQRWSAVLAGVGLGCTVV